MIIKRNKAEQMASRADQARRDSDPAESDWTSERIEQKLLPDRRSRPETIAERRRSYRRVEDKSLITQAHEEAVAIRENAERQGFEEGLNRAAREIQTFREILEKLMITRDTVLASVADDLAPVAVEIAERIIKTEVSCDETLVLGIVHDTLHKIGRNARSVLIKVHPDDARIVKDSLREKPPQSLNAEIMVMDDPAVDRGSCIVETNSGLIDASFSTRLEILKRLFGNDGEKV